VTNDPGSPLALAAEFVIDTDTGPEKSVAATKTYTAQLTAIALLSAGMDDRAESLEELERLPGWVDETLHLESQIKGAVPRYREMKQCVALGRGFNYATAQEWSLKLKELTYVAAAPYSAADFRHGPLAILERGFPVLAVAPQGEVLADMLDLIQGVSSSFEADLTIISNVQAALQLATTPLPIPSDTPEWLSPIVAIVPAQLFSHQLALEKGIDVEHPRGLQKVTKTW
jgi:glucosamine--fructose-6-phosphate aminotransferase (isomerizing)